MWWANTELLQAPQRVVFCHRRSPWMSPSHPFGMCVPSQIPAREWDAAAWEQGKHSVFPGLPFRVDLGKMGNPSQEWFLALLNTLHSIWDLLLLLSYSLKPHKQSVMQNLQGILNEIIPHWGDYKLYCRKNISKHLTGSKNPWLPLQFQTAVICDYDGANSRLGEEGILFPV